MTCEFPIRHKNAHDVEDVLLCDFLREHNDEIKSVLDVGAHYSHATYAPEVRSLIAGKYHAVDILPDEKTAAIVDHYYGCNLLERQVHGLSGYEYTVSLSYDCVFSISALEHCGMTSYKRDNPREERLRVIRRINELSNQFIFLTFPFGKFAHVPGQYENITNDELHDWMDVLGHKCWTQFFFSESPQGGKPWKRISSRECAEIPRDPTQDQQTVAVCHWIK